MRQAINSIYDPSPVIHLNINYSVTTQLNSTSSWVELCRYKRPLNDDARSQVKLSQQTAKLNCETELRNNNDDDDDDDDNIVRLFIELWNVATGKSTYKDKENYKA